MSRTPLAVAAAQISSGPDVQTNLSVVHAAVDAAADAGARLLVLPEASMVAFGNDLAAAAQPLDGPFASAVREHAARAGIVVVVGMFTPSGDGRVRNTLLVTGPGVEASYDKIHLYDAFGSRESDTVAPGTEHVVVDVDGIGVGLATCYDLRFADQFTALGRRGADLVVVPASWGEGPGKAAQWDVLTRARAMDAQAWLVACDQAWVAPAGTDPLGIGETRLVDPLGRVVTSLTQAPGMLAATIDPATVDDVRRRIPVLG